MKVIALINQKGGVGKTTSAINIGFGLSKLKQKVLLIDLDPQAHLTYSIGIHAHQLEKTIYDVLKGTVKIQEVIVEKYGVKIIPASLELSGAEIELSGIAGKEFLLKESLNACKDFDYILLDCPPSLGVLTLNALTAANQIYIPLQTEFLALQGVGRLTETVNIVRKRLNTELEITGIIGTRFDKRKSLSNEVIAKIKEYFGPKLFKTLIRDNVALAEAPSHGKPIFEYKLDCYGSEDNLNLSKEILKRNK
jgi:chromosome partitioning protein